MTESAICAELAAQRAIAEKALERAKHRADTLRTKHAAALLRETFPRHEVAIFARNWDEDEPSLMQLLTTAESVGDIDRSKGDGRLDLTREQWSAINQAENAIILIGPDDDILDHLDPSNEEHDGWVEFRLPLTQEETTA